MTYREILLQIISNCDDLDNEARVTIVERGEVGTTIRFTDVPLRYIGLGFKVEQQEIDKTKSDQWNPSKKEN